MRGVESARYPLGTTTSYPDNDAEGTEAHHCFPRSQQIGDSWFVEITYDSKKEAEEQAALLAVKAVKTGHPGGWGVVIPHVVNLTMEEHSRVEMHDAKILLEDGVWVWYDAQKQNNDKDDHPEWVKIGALNPQPGSREGKPKKKRRKKAEGEVLRNRGTWQVRVPKDEIEDGANLLDEDVEVLRDLLIALEAPGVNADSPTYQIVKPAFTWAIAALGLEHKSRKKAEREERARKKAERAAA